MSFVDLLIDSCTIQRYTEGAVDGYGTPARTWAAHLTGEHCRLMTGTGSSTGAGREVMVGAEVVIADYTLFIEDVDITEQDRVIIDSVTYEVLLVSDRANAVHSHHKACFMRVVR